MVENKIAQRAVAAGLSGLMAFGAAAPAALAYTNYNAFKRVSTTSSDDSAHWKRLAGKDRYETMKKIVESYNEIGDTFWKSIRKGYGSDTVYNYHSTVVLASGDNWPDALAANGLAGYLTNTNLYRGDFESVPVLITKAGSLSAETKDLLKGMQVQNVIIMGGTAAVSQDVEDAINKMGIGTQRVAGADRQETSVKALQRINGNWKAQDKNYDLIIASGNNYADALSISPYAYRMGTPILLTDKDGKLTEQQVQAIKDNSDLKEIVIVGGTEAVKDDVLGQIGTIKNNRAGINVVRIAGVDRYETSAKIAQFEIDDWGNAWGRYAWRGNFTFNHAIVATGENFPDALVGGQLAGGLNAATMINVDGFSTADLNDWSPCPLLLVKDGDTRADSMIAQGIAKGRVSTGTDTFESFGSWVNTIDNWYDGAVVEKNALFLDVFDSWYLEGPKFISDRAIDGNTTSTAAQTILSQGISDLELVFDVDWTETTPATATSASKGTYTFTLKGIKVDGNAMYDVDCDPIAPVDHDAIATVANHKITVKNLEWWSDVHAVPTFANNTALDVILDHDDFDHQDTTISVKVDDVAWTQRKAAAAEGQRVEYTGWMQNIIAYVESDEDFYGIILGGKNAVSNDKRDDLEKAVDNFGASYNTDIFTVGGAPQGTITVVDKKGVANNYNYLDPVKVDAASKGAAFAAGYTADVYHIYGTDSHVVCVFDDNDDFYGWYYYYGKGSALTTDWTI